MTPLASLLLCAAMALALAACSAGRLPPKQSAALPKGHNATAGSQVPWEDSSRLNELMASILNKARLSTGAQSTIYAHPGMLMLVDWGGGRAGDAGRFLQKLGLGRDVLRVTRRDCVPMLERMRKERPTDILAIHYSMGADPSVLANALNVVRQVSHETGTVIRYHPILVEPYRFSRLQDKVNLDDAHLGTVYAVVSAEYSFLRPRLDEGVRHMVEHPKVHLLQAEDFGLTWGHFSFLGEVRSQSAPNGNKEARSKALLTLLGALPLAGFQGEAIDLVLDMVRYAWAREDGRPAPPATSQRLHAMWLEQGPRFNLAPRKDEQP